MTLEFKKRLKKSMFMLLILIAITSQLHIISGLVIHSNKINFSVYYVRRYFHIDGNTYVQSTSNVCVVRVTESCMSSQYHNTYTARQMSA